MPQALWVVRVAEHPEFSASTIRSAAFLARHSDANGIVDPGASGLRFIGDALGLSDGSISRALTQLNEAAFIELQKVSPRERFTGAPSRIRLLLNAPEA